jgi:hypothetical protein
MSIQDDLVSQVEDLKGMLVEVEEATILSRSIFYFSESAWQMIIKEIRWLEDKAASASKYITELEEKIDGLEEKLNEKESHDE